MISYIHPARPAGRHAACRTFDDAGHTCTGHICYEQTVVCVSPVTRQTWVITGESDLRSYPARYGTKRGAHRATVSLVKSYV